MTTCRSKRIDLPRLANQLRISSATTLANWMRSSGSLIIIRRTVQRPKEASRDASRTGSWAARSDASSIAAAIDPSGNGGLTGQQEVQRAAQAVDVGPASRPCGCSAPAPAPGSRPCPGRNRRRSRSARTIILGESGQPQVEHLDAPVLVRPAVGRLDVAMDQPGVVGVLQAHGRLGDVIGRFQTSSGPSSLTIVCRSRPSTYSITM